MTTAPFWQDARSAIYLGDACDVLAAMPAGSADCIVTSPPYWAKRDYGVAGQYGREPSPGRLRRDPARGVPRGAARPGRGRDLLAQPRRLLHRERRDP